MVRADLEALLEVRPPHVPRIRPRNGWRGWGGPASPHVGGGPRSDVLADRKDRQTNRHVRRGTSGDRLHSSEFQ